MKHHHFFPTLLTVSASLAVAHAQPEAPVRWAVDRASGPGTTAGFPEIDGVQHVELMRVTPETGTYSHHPHILHDGQRFFAAWSNHRVDEDGPGIATVLALDTRTSARKRIAARLFADCTGHGTIGALAGADYEMVTPEDIVMGLTNKLRPQTEKPGI